MDEAYEEWKAGELKAKKLVGQVTLEEAIAAAERDEAAGRHGGRGDPGTSRLMGHETPPAAPPRPKLTKGARMGFAELMGEALTGEIEGAFRKMELAEDEIRQACERHDEDVKDHGKIWSTFRLMTPTVDMPSEDVYRAHCRELAERVANEQDTRPGTDAEIVMVISEMSMSGRGLSDVALALMVRTFKLVIADRAPREIEGLAADATKAEVDRLEYTMRQKLAQDWRT